MSIRYFKKEMIRNQVTSNGIRLGFEEVADNEGVLGTEDQATIEACIALISRNIGGVSEITLQEFNDLKKKERVTKQFASGGRSAREPMPHRGPETQLIKQTQVVADAVAANAKEKVAREDKKEQESLPTARPARIQRVPKL